MPSISRLHSTSPPPSPFPTPGAQRLHYISLRKLQAYSTMVKAGEWFRSLLTGKKEKIQVKEIEKFVWQQLPPTPPPPPTTPKEKMRSFNLEMEKYNTKDQFTFLFLPALEQRRHSMAAASLTEDLGHLARAARRKSRFASIEQIAAIRIQSSFRSYLARKALRALKALVKLQAVVRGFLVRKQAAATLRCLQVLLTAQARARAQRVQISEVFQAMPSKLQELQDMEKNVEIEGEPKGSLKIMKSSQITHSETKERRNFSHIKPSGPSVFNETSSRTRSSRLDEYSSFAASKNNSQFSSPPPHKPGRMSFSEELLIQEGPYMIFHESPLFPNYMAKTESSRAKVRSQSAPRQMPESFDQGRTFCRFM